MASNDNPNPSKFTGLHRFAELVTQAVKCEEVADALPLRGVGKERFCPKCQANAVHPVPFLILANKSFECANCHVKGDVIDLVMVTKLCSLDEAVKWLADYLKMDSMTLEMHESHASDPSQSDAILGLEEEELRSRVRREYLKMCRGLPDKALGMLTEVGISVEALKKLDVHYPPRRMDDIINDLRIRFSRKILKSSGLFFSPDAGEEDETQARRASQDLPGKLKAENSLACIFRPYDRNKIRYLIIPYYEFGRVVYIKARPVVSSDMLRRLKLPKFIATSNDIPCLYNVDALSQGGPIIVFRNELDVMAAVSVGFSAVACSTLNKFNPAWIMLLAGRHIWFYDDGEPGTDKALSQIEAMFSSIGQKRPGRIARRSGEALIDAIRRLGTNIGRPIIEPPVKVVPATVTKKTIESIAEDLAALDPHPEENSQLPAVSNTKQLLASIPIETGLQLVVYTFRHEGTSLIRLRYQRFMKQTGQWKDLDTPVMTFDAAIAGQLIDAIDRARRA